MTGLDKLRSKFWSEKKTIPVRTKIELEKIEALLENAEALADYSVIQKISVGCLMLPFFAGITTFFTMRYASPQPRYNDTLTQNQAESSAATPGILAGIFVTAFLFVLFLFAYRIASSKRKAEVLREMEIFIPKVNEALGINFSFSDSNPSATDVKEKLVKEIIPVLQFKINKLVKDTSSHESAEDNSSSDSPSATDVKEKQFKISELVEDTSSHELVEDNSSHESAEDSSSTEQLGFQ